MFILSTDGLNSLTDFHHNFSNHHPSTKLSLEPSHTSMDFPGTMTSYNSGTLHTTIYRNLQITTLTSTDLSRALPQEIGEDLPTTEAAKREETASQTVNPVQLDRRMESWQAATASGEMGPGGVNAIAGVLVQSSKEKMSIHRAMMRGVLTQGTALVLLEAQAAIGFIIDPVKNKKVPVRDALAAGLTGGDYYGKLLSAERAVTGYTDPYTGNKISLFQAMKKDLLVKDHGIRLLEAQIATGGIIDPVHSHRLPVEVAYKRGYFDEEINRILSDPQKHSRSCFDPNTHENLTYMQLLSRCVPDPDTGLLMLQLMHKGSVLFQLDEQTRISLQSAPATVSVGLFQGQNVTVWELLFSRYVPDQKRQELLKKYKAGTLTIQEMTTIITTLITETEKKSNREPRNTTTSEEAETPPSPCDKHLEKALRSETVDIPVREFKWQEVSLWELLFSSYISDTKRQELLKKYRAGTLTIQEMITILITSITEAEGKSRKLLTTRRTPSKEMRKPSEKEKDAPSHEEQETEKALKSTLVEVQAGEFHGQKVSVWDLLFSKYIPKEKRKELLELHRAGILTTDQMKTIITTIVSKTEEESHHLPGHGESPSAETTTSEEAETPPSPCDKHLEKALRSETVDIPVGEFKWQEVSLWELLFSSYISDTKRQELLKKYRAGTLPIQEMITILTTSITEAEGKSRKLPTTRKTPSKEMRKPSEKDKDAPSHEEQETEKALKSTFVEVPAGEFHGQKVSVWDLLFSKYIPKEKRKELLELHRAGILTTDQMKTIVTTIVSKTEEESHHLPGHGESPSAETTTSEEAETPPSPCDKHLEKALRSETVDIPVGEFKWQEVSLWELLFSSYISDTKRQELLKKYRAGTLTTQEMITILTTSITEVETGSRNLCVNTKAASEGGVISDKAEDAHSQEQHMRKSLKRVTIYVTAGEFQGQNVSLLDLLFSKYILQEKRQELLALYRARVLSVEQMIPIITSIITKTEATSRQLMTSVKSPNREEITLQEAVAAHSPQDTQLDNILKATTIDGPVSEFHEQKVSVWDLLFSNYIPEEKRQELLELYRAGILTMDQVITVVTTLIKKKEATSRKFVINVKTPSKDTMTLEEAEDVELHEDKKLEKALKSTMVDVPTGEFHEQKVSVWDLLFSNYIPEEKRQELLELYRAGILTMDQVITVVTTLIKKKEATSRKFVINVKTPSKDTMTLEEAENVELHEDKKLEKALKSTMVDVPTGEFHEQKVSVWDLLFSNYIPEEKRQELLELYRAGILTMDQVITVVTTLIKKKEDVELHEDKKLEKALKSTMVDVPTGEFHEQKVSVWDLLFSNYIPEEKRQELLELYRAGILTMDQVITVITSIVTKIGVTRRKLATNVHSPSAEREADTAYSERNENQEMALKSTTVGPVGKFQGPKVSVWDLLFSKYVPKETRQELLEKHRAGMLTTEKMITSLTTIISHTLEEGLSPDNQQILNLLQSEVSYVTVGQFQDQRVSVWELLSSKCVSQYNREVHLDTYNAGKLAVNDITITTTVITGSEGKKGAARNGE
ncbi:epiplakin-like [Eretmochelys imbricata]